VYEAPWLEVVTIESRTKLMRHALAGQQGFLCEFVLLDAQW
jgi:hypothetical protein